MTVPFVVLAADLALFAASERIPVAGRRLPPVGLSPPVNALVSGEPGPGNDHCMAIIGWLWLVSPFVLIALIAHDQDLQRVVANNLGQARAAGSAGALMMFLGVAAVPGAIGAAMYALGTPLVGLLAFLRRDDRDDGGEDAPGEPPTDWDEFERSFRDYARRPQGSPRRPRSPSAA